MGRVLGVAGAELDTEQAGVAARALARRPRPLEVDLGSLGRATIYPVGAVGDVDAALLCLRPVTALDRAERDALEQAARFLSLEVARQQTVQAIEQRFASELLDMVLSGAHRAAEVPGRLRAFGVDPDAPLAVCAVSLRTGEPTLPGMVEAITDFFLAESLPALVAGGSQDVVAVLPWRQQTSGLPELAGRLVAALAARFPDREPVAGIGDTAADATDLRRPLGQAREAARVLRGRRGGPAVTTFAELGGYRLLLGLQEPEQLQRFAETILGPLREHDRRRGGELETTLRAFLDHDGHWATTAEALYVHVNTLRNRLARIAELTGRDVGRTADRVDLFLALEAER
jgi:PucR family transcriptional regulator, purine catabolism regulatory protein